MKKAKTAPGAVALTASQSASRDNVMGVTHCSADQAVRFLQLVNWNADLAIGQFFESGERAEGSAPAGAGAGGGGGSGGGKGDSYDQAKVEAVFAAYEYRNADGTASALGRQILGQSDTDGCMRFFRDLGLNAPDEA